MNRLMRLAEFAALLPPEAVPDAAWSAARLSVLDTAAAAVGGSRSDLAERVRRQMRHIYGTEGPASVWGQATGCPGPAAAFLNGWSGHVLELDDVHTRSKTHIGTVVVPAAWAMAQAAGRDGRELLLAVICGYETAARIGMGFGVSSHRNRGWHATSTAGVFGAAAACGRLLGLSPERMAAALGLAGAQSFGTWAFLEDGADNKALHPARAAASGYEAACLAASGVRGPLHILDSADGGLYTAMTDAPEPAAVDRELGTAWEITRVDRKPYPCCRSTHCAIDAALALRQTGSCRAEEVESVLIRTYQVGFRQCGESRGSRLPRTPIEAKFSTPYAVACALLRGHVTVEDFTPERIADPAVQALLRRVTVVPEERFTAVYPSHWGCAMEVTRGGAALGIEVSDASGSVACPMTEDQVRQKAEGLLRPSLGERAGELSAALLALDAGPLPAL